MEEPLLADERKVALDAALKKIEKNFGKGSIMRLGENAQTQISTVPSGSLKLDIALGVGGYPKGRIVEIYGPESSGKTTLALHAVAEIQKAGGTAAYIDAENALDSKYAENLGVKIDDLLLSQPDTGEQGLEIADALVSSGAIDILVVDSVAALVPRAEIEGEMGDAHVGLQARLMSQALRKLSGSINKTGTIAILSTKFVKKLGLCLVILKRHRVVAHLSSTQPSVLKFDVQHKLKMVPILLVTTRRLKLLKIRLRHHLKLLKLILCMVKGYHKLVN